MVTHRCTECGWPGQIAGERCSICGEYGLAAFAISDEWDDIPTQPDVRVPAANPEDEPESVRAIRQRLVLAELGIP